MWGEGLPGEKKSMSTEVTASIMIGPLAPNSTHGQPLGDRRHFAPSHVMTLMEGHRATWVVQECPHLHRPAHARFIRPASPQHLLAAAVLGYTALVRPAALKTSDRLRNAVEREMRNGDLRVLKIDDEQAEAIFANCSQYVYGLVTVLPECTINDDEVRMAADHGMQVAVSRYTGGNSAVA